MEIRIYNIVYKSLQVENTRNDAIKLIHDNS